MSERIKVTVTGYYTPQAEGYSDPSSVESMMREDHSAYDSGDVGYAEVLDFCEGELDVQFEVVQ